MKFLSTCFIYPKLLTLPLKKRMSFLSARKNALAVNKR